MEVNTRKVHSLGKVRKVLASKRLEPLPNNYVGVELCETVHVHMPGFRFELTLEQFIKYADILSKAKENWNVMGCPKEDGDDFKLLGGGYLPGEPVYNTRYEVEQQVIPSVHLHMRGLSIRFPITKFVEEAEMLYYASKNIES